MDAHKHTGIIFGHFSIIEIISICFDKQYVFIFVLAGGYALQDMKQSQFLIVCVQRSCQVEIEFCTQYFPLQIGSN